MSCQLGSNHQLTLKQLKLLIELKQKDIEIKKLELELEKVKLQRDCLGYQSQPNKIKLKITLKPQILNFGEECCDIFEEFSDDILFDIICIGQILLKLLHFNPKYPQNQNIKIVHDEYISIYVNNEWQDIYIDSVIDEYIKGNIMRLKQSFPQKCTEFDNILYNDTHLDQLRNICKQTMLTQSLKSPS